MKDEEERSPQTAETDSLNLEEWDDRDPLRPTVLPFSIPSLLLPVPSTGSAVFARAWTRQVVSSLLWRQLAQVSLAVAGSIAADTIVVENDFLTSDGRLALLLLLSSGKLGSIAGLSGGLPRAPVGRTDLLSPLSDERLEREKNERP